MAVSRTYPAAGPSPCDFYDSGRPDKALGHFQWDLKGANAPTYHACVTLDINDATTRSSGSITGLFVDYVTSGTNTGGLAQSAAINMTIEGDIPIAYNLNLGTGTIANKTVGTMVVLSIYVNDIGTAVGNFIGIDIGRVANNQASDRDTFMRFKGHSTSGLSKTVFYLEGTNNKLAEQFIMFAGVGTSDWLDTSVNLGSGHSRAGVLKVGLEAVIGGGVTTQYYIPLYTAN